MRSIFWSLPMVRRVVCLLGLGFLLVTGVAAGDAQKDQEKIQGFWKAVKATASGKELPADIVAEMKMEFAGDKAYDIEECKKAGEFSFKLDPAKKPRHIDLLYKDGKKILGIYEVSGDTLKLCVGEKKRPEAFTSPAGSDVILTVMQRVKK
jgi:uncharacterized protein (TIGR03067 family)